MRSVSHRMQRLLSLKRKTPHFSLVILSRIWNHRIIHHHHNHQFARAPLNQCSAVPYRHNVYNIESWVGPIRRKISLKSTTESSMWVSVLNRSRKCVPCSLRSGNSKQEAFEKCWAHSPQRAASRPFSRCRQRYCRVPHARWCPRHLKKSLVVRSLYNFI